MKFCPKCEIRLKKDDSGLTCPKCNYQEQEVVIKESKKIVKEDKLSEFNVFEGDEGKDALPSIKIDCAKCGHDEAIWWMLQTRSADEPTTQFYRCTKCSYTWRDYS